MEIAAVDGNTITATILGSAQKRLSEYREDNILRS
jgi:hypothetical protein